MWNMRRFGNILSDDPKDLEGALEWAKKEIERMKREDEATAEVRMEMRPILERAMEIRNRRLARTNAAS